MENKALPAGSNQQKREPGILGMMEPCRLTRIGFAAISGHSEWPGTSAGFDFPSRTVVHTIPSATGAKYFPGQSAARRRHDRRIANQS